MNLRRKLFFAGLCGMLALPAITMADEPAPPGVRAAVERQAQDNLIDTDDQADEADDDEGEVAHDRRWIGLHVGAVPAVLQKHLKLKQGVIVEEVLPDTPAAKAGLEAGDILLAIDDKPVDGPDAVREAVDAAKDDAELTLSLLHQGEKTTVKVKPIDRPGFRGPDDRRPPMGPFRGGDPRRQEAFQRAMLRLGRSLEGGEDMNMMFLRPGVVADAAKLPKGTTITVTRSGDEPTQIVVQRGDKRWEATGDQLDKLPEDLRSHVAGMLGEPMPMLIAPGPDARRTLRVLPNGEVVGELHLNPRSQLPPLPQIIDPAGGPQNDGGMSQVLEAIEQLSKRVEKLQEKVDQKP